MDITATQPSMKVTTPVCYDTQTSREGFTSACSVYQQPLETSTPTCHIPVESSLQASHDNRQQIISLPPACPGYSLVIDNIDMNVRRSYQRLGQTTQSYHFCHGYAALNRVNSTALSDESGSGILSPEFILPSQADLESILNDFAVLVSR